MDGIKALIELSEENDWPPEIVVSRQDWANLASRFTTIQMDERGPYAWIGGYLTRVRPMPPMTSVITLANHLRLSERGQ